MHFTVDNESDRWSEKVVKNGEGRRYSKESGQEYFDERGEVIDYLSGISEWPKLVRMLKPSKFEIWGRLGDKWRMTGAESAEHGYLMHLDREESRSVAELFVDTTFSLPLRWTEVHPLGPAKQEIEIKGLHIPVEWKRLTGMDMSEKGEHMFGGPPLPDY